MALPIPVTPSYHITLPVSGLSCKFRPFLVGEQKLLNIASESDKTLDSMQATLDLLVRCTIEPEAKAIQNLSVADCLFYLLNIRARSVSETIDIDVKCSKCQKSFPSSILISDIQMQAGDKHNGRVSLAGGLVLQMRYPSITDTIEAVRVVKDVTDEIEIGRVILKKIIVNVYDKESTFSFQDSTEAEKDDFVDHLTLKDSGDIEAFINQIPKMVFEHKCQCLNCKEQNNVKLEGFQDFFG